MPTSIPGNSCPTCCNPAVPCLFNLADQCVYYSGANIANAGIHTGDTLTSVINKLANQSSGGTVTSVGLSTTGTALSVAGSPVTTTGTFALSWTGNSSQYVTGAGDLATLPAQFAPIAGTNMTITGTYPGLTFNAAGSVTSVGLTMPSAFTVSGGPITSSGTFSVTGAGTTGQYIRGDGSLSSLPVQGAVNGASLSGTNVVLGQDVGAVGSPAALTSNREIPLAGKTLELTGSGLLSVGTPTATRFSPTNMLVTQTAQMQSIYVNGDILTQYTNHCGITSEQRPINISSGEYGTLIEDTSAVQLFNGFAGYSGMYSTGYCYSLSPITPAGAAYISGFSAIPIFEMAPGGGALPLMYGFFSAMNVQAGTLTNGYDFFSKELNSVQRVPNVTPNVTNHYAFYAEPQTKATNNWGVYIAGVQKNYFGGVVGIHNTSPTALMHLGPGQAVAGSGQLKFDSSLLLTTPETGVMEYSSNQLYFTRSGSTREVVLTGLSGASAPATTAGTTIANFYGTSATNFLGTPNNWLSIVIGGTTYKIPLYT